MMHRVLVNRRGFLASGVSALVAQQPLAAVAADSACKAPPATAITDMRADVAVSLREALKRAKSGGPKRLTGLTRIDAVCRDDDNDILLCGVAERGQPDLYLDDLIVAIRSADRKYGKIEPGISLDPDRSQTPGLDQIAGRDAAAKQQYLRMCSQQPQMVRVDALPRHSRVTKVLVEADYRMQQVSQGTLQLPVDPPLPGTFTRRLNQSRQMLRAGTSTGDWSSRRRFWFEPGKFEYAHDYETAFLQSAQVILSDADADADAGAKSGNEDPIAREFACDWTARMEETIRAEPIWRDMYNIYRHFAIAHILKERNLYAYDLTRLIDAHEIDHVALPDSLPGLGRWETLEEAKGNRRLTLVSSVCGGVSLGLASRLTANRVSSESKSPSQMALLSRAIVLSRPEKSSVSWTVPPTALQAAAKWYVEREEQRLQAARESEEKERKEANDIKMGMALLGGFVVTGILAGWLLNRRNAPTPELAAAGPGASSTSLLKSPGEPGTSGELAGLRRNDLCPCNSGKRFKHCHGAHEAT
ncbi:SEC-C metal-binding domain-containing protein [Bradyrhizobium sp. TM102]|uniref:SEC-C metal-binding domain-containing protein n=1 Tax=Bradyrhizobium sp. TM102 TaxID=2599819 RepID=UPI0012A05BC3|nr:SEC-C metal-binding domain-containing protein [Bradyrhizobium sp. TM102]BBO08915.1 hypothetical protein TM102_03850 [Bradyrhizobium sp. TM102]